MTKIKTIREFLGMPIGSIGEIVKETGLWSADVKFECKPEPIQIQYPMDSHYHKIEEVA